MTAQTVDWPVEQLHTRDVGVRLRAEHLCLSLHAMQGRLAELTGSVRTLLVEARPETVGEAVPGAGARCRDASEVGCPQHASDEGKHRD